MHSAHRLTILHTSESSRIRERLEATLQLRRSSPGLPLRDVVMLAMTWGIIISAAEIVAMVVAPSPFGVDFWLDPDITWAMPLVNVSVAVLVALIIRLLVRTVRREQLTFVLGVFAVFAPLVHLDLLSSWASLVLAAGVAAVIARNSTSDRAERRIRRAGSVLAIGIAVLGGVAPLSQRERITEAPVVRPEAPNVLVLILDTVRAASLRLHGGRTETPALEGLGASGVVFERAIAPAPWTLPSHASMFTGKMPFQLGADWVAPLGTTPPVLAEELARVGYRTGGFVANMIYTSRGRGLERGFQTYLDHRRTPMALLRKARLVERTFNASIVRALFKHRDIAGRKYAEDVNGEFLDWLDADSLRPWIAFLNYFDAHEPYLPRPPFAGRYSAGVSKRAFRAQRCWRFECAMIHWNNLTANEVAAENAAYDEAIAELDSRIGDLLDSLRQRGALEHTLVIVTSDHGESFGEHGVFTHGDALDWPALHVPLIISWPGHVPAGTRVTQPVSLSAIGSTALDLVIDDPDRLSGESLRPLIEGDTTSPGPVFAELSAEPQVRSAVNREDSWSVFFGNWQMTRDEAGQESLFLIEGMPLTARQVPVARHDSMARKLRAFLGAVPRERPDPQ